MRAGFERVDAHIDLWATFPTLMYCMLSKQAQNSCCKEQAGHKSFVAQADN
jgi:hypothetical protein